MKKEIKKFSPTRIREYRNMPLKIDAAQGLFLLFFFNFSEAKDEK